MPTLGTLENTVPPKGSPATVSIRAKGLAVLPATAFGPLVQNGKRTYCYENRCDLAEA